MRPVDGVSAEVAECPEGRIHKSIRVQVADRVRRRFPIRINRIHSRHHIWSLVEVGRRGKDIEARATGVVRIYDRHRTATLCSDDGIELPSPGQALGTRKIRQTVTEGRGETVSGSKVGWAVLG